MKGWRYRLLSVVSLCCLLSMPSWAEQTLSGRLGEVVQQHVARSLAADLQFQDFQLLTQSSELRVTEMTLATRIAELDEGLNQALRAERMVVHGDWLTSQRNQLVLHAMELSGAQLNIAYFAPGRSNLHVLLEALQQPRVQPASMQLIWQLDEITLENVVINLFDQGQPLLSMRLQQLRLADLRRPRGSDEVVTETLWPLLEQALAGSNAEVVVDTRRLLAFMWREAR